MSAIGSRFGALLINAENPYDKVVKKTKGKKTVETAKSAEKKKPSVPQTSEKSAPKAPQNVVEKQKKPSKTNPEVLNVQSSKPKPDVQIKVEPTKPTPEVKPAPRKDSQPQKPSKPKVEITKVEAVQQNNNASAEAKTDNGFVPEEKKKPIAEIAEDLTEKDDRGSSARSTYQRVMVSRGRVFERRGGEKTRVKAIEKKQGHGAYNWGEIDTAGDEALNQTAPETEVAQPEAKPEKKVTQNVQYTLDQYKEMLKGDKVDPLIWQNQPAANAEETSDHDDLREYQYNPREYAPRGGSDQRRYNDNRGRRFTRGGRYNSRGSRGGAQNYRGESRGRGNHRGSDVRLDDVKDFPEL